MSQDVIVFRDRSENVERRLCLKALSLQAKQAPTIEIKFDKLGSDTMVEATAAAKASPVVSVFEYRDRYYVLTGHDAVTRMIKEAQEMPANAGAALLKGKHHQGILAARLITKHLAKKAVPTYRS